MSDVKNADNGTAEVENKVEEKSTEKKVAASKKKKDEPNPEDLAAAGGKTAEYFEEQGAKSASNRSTGGEDVKISLTNKTLVRFTKNHGFFKEGHVQEISDVALAIYEKAKVIEKL